MNYTKRPSFTEFSIEPSQQLKESLQAINVDVNDRAIRLLKEAMPASIERISGLLPVHHLAGHFTNRRRQS